MNGSYQVYYKIIVKILNSLEDCELQKVLISHNSFCNWAIPECQLTKSDLDFKLYAQIKEFIERTCVNLRLLQARNSANLI